jgi:hypothetical protein
MRSRLPIPVLLTLPGLVMAVAGLSHPHDLNAQTAEHWWHLHVAGLVGFPLVGIALAFLMRGRADPVAWIVRLSAYAYIVFYGALDVLDGIGAGYLTLKGPDGNDAYKLFELAHPYEFVGSWGLIVCCIAVSVDQVVRHRWLGLPVVLMVPGAWLVHTDHIFSPHGVQGMVLIGLATGYAAWNVPETRWPLTATIREAGAS